MSYKLMTDKATAYAQIILSIVFIAGYFMVLSDFIHGNIKVGIEWKDTIGALLAILTASVLQICNYWFSRHRDSKPEEKG